MHLTVYLPVHAYTHDTVYFPCACLYASMHLRQYPPYACLDAFHCLLSLSHASTHFTVYFPCACLYALASLLAIRMPLCISLSTFPTRASMHFTVYFFYAVELRRTQGLYRKNPSQCFRKPFNKSKDKTKDPGKDDKGTRKPRPLPWITTPRHRKPRNLLSTDRQSQDDGGQSACRPTEWKNSSYSSNYMESSRMTRTS